ncbi:MAG: L,D-transpeptidase, partial [Bacillota bacterium]|nr:L,D-transpeptidase [Bacillota bacterium]
GDFRILEKEVNPGGILGSRWMRFYKGYGIHGTNQPELIGQAVSKGCIRMHNHHIEAIYPLVSIRTPVHIREALGKPSWPPGEPGERERHRGDG